MGNRLIPDTLRNTDHERGGISLGRVIVVVLILLAIGYLAGYLFVVSTFGGDTDEEDGPGTTIPSEPSEESTSLVRTVSEPR